jgi:hypothetical protein
MAVPSYATDLAAIIEDMASTTGWTLISSGGGGANSLTAPETDDFIQGSSCISRNPWTSANIRGMLYNAATTVASGDAVFLWWKSDVAQALDTLAAGGIQCLIGSGTTAFDCFYVDGSDTYARGGWKCNPIDPAANPSTSVGTPTASTAYFGVRWSIAASGPNKGFPYKIDAIRHGSQIEITAGEIANPATIDAAVTYADDITRRWGILQPTPTGMSQQGAVYWGTAAALCYSRDANRTIVLLDTQGFTTTSFTAIIIANASTDLVWTNISILSLDTLNRGTFEVLNNAAFQFLNGAFEDINTTTDGGTNSVWDGTVWRRTNAITAAGGTFIGCRVLEPTVAADSSPFVYNVATDPDGILDDMEFVSHATTAHHAIELGLSSPLTVTLRGITFTGFNAANAANDSVIHVLRTTGTVTINAVACSGTVSYKTAGATVVVVVDPVTTSVHVQDIDTAASLQSAQVWVAVTSTAGGKPFAASITITSSGTTATVTHTSHGLSTNDFVFVSGANESRYNGTYQITSTGASSYTYTMAASTTSPATGTIVSTFVVISGSTDVSGNISSSYSFSAAQPITGRVRLSSSAPFYKTSPITGTIDNLNGLSITSQMIPD